jgi:xylulokinase
MTRLKSFKPTGSSMTKMDKHSNCLLVIDLGTSTCKAAIFSPDGELLGIGRRWTPATRTDTGRVDTSPEAWWDTAVEVIGEAIQRSSIQADSIVGIGLCAFMHTPIGMDDSGQVVTPTLFWNDLRGEEQARCLVSKAKERFLEITGDLPRHNHTVAKILWLVDSFPDCVKSVRCWLLPKDYLRYRLTGQIATDVSDAIGTMFYDPVRADWDETLVRLSGTRLECLPEIKSSTDLSGVLTTEAAEALGLRSGIPVAIGSADGYATLLGANCCSQDRVCLYMGTSAWIIRFIPDPDVDPRKKMTPAPGGYHQWVGAVSCAGASLTWLGGLLGIVDERVLEQEAEMVPPGARGLFFFPHLAGERGPIHSAAARGGFLGLTLAHSRKEVIRAVYEGVCFQIRHVLDANPFGKGAIQTILVGGGARSQFWAQMLSDVLNLELETPHILEAGALGGALIAGAAVGLLEDPHESAQRLFRKGAEFIPDSKKVDLYTKLFMEYIDHDSKFAA